MSAKVKIYSIEVLKCSLCPNEAWCPFRTKSNVPIPDDCPLPDKEE